MADEGIVASGIDLPVKRPREEEEQGKNMTKNNGNGVSSVSMETEDSNKLPNSFSSIIPGWFSEISPMWPGLSHQSKSHLFFLFTLISLSFCRWVFCFPLIKGLNFFDDCYCFMFIYIWVFCMCSTLLLVFLIFNFLSGFFLLCVVLWPRK